MEGIVLLIGGSVTLGFVLIFLLALSEKKKIKKADGASENGDLGLSAEHFQKACLLVVEGMKLDIEEINATSEDKVDIMAKDPRPITGGQFLIHCLYRPRGETILSPEIIELSNMVLQERVSKGIFITTGRFTEEILSIGELAPIEFIDGNTLQGLIAKYAPDYRVTRS